MRALIIPAAAAALAGCAADALQGNDGARYAIYRHKDSGQVFMQFDMQTASDCDALLSIAGDVRGGKCSPESVAQTLPVRASLQAYGPPALPAHFVDMSTCQRIGSVPLALGIVIASRCAMK